MKVVEVPDVGRGEGAEQVVERVEERHERVLVVRKPLHLGRDVICHSALSQHSLHSSTSRPRPAPVK